jgi:pseudouridine kinase
VESLTPRQVEAWAPRIAHADFVVADANFTVEAAQALAALSSCRRVLLTTSREKAPRLRGVLQGAGMLAGTCDEAAVLTGLPPGAEWRRIGEAVLACGVARAVLTHGGEGVGVITRDGAAWAAAVETKVVDATGAGDAAAAAAVHALASGLGPAETASAAAAAAAVVVGSDDNTLPGLSEALRSPR